MRPDLLAGSFLIEHRSHDLGQFVHGHRFQQEFPYPDVGDILLAQAFIVPGTDDHRRRCIKMVQALGQLDAGELGHGHVGNDKVDLGDMAQQIIKRLLAIGKTGDRISQPAQDF